MTHVEERLRDLAITVNELCAQSVRLDDPSLFYRAVSVVSDGAPLGGGRWSGRAYCYQLHKASKLYAAPFNEIATPTLHKEWRRVGYRLRSSFLFGIIPRGTLLEFLTKHDFETARSFTSLDRQIVTMQTGFSRWSSKEWCALAYPAERTIPLPPLVSEPEHT